MRSGLGPRASGLGLLIVGCTSSIATQRIGGLRITGAPRVDPSLVALSARYDAPVGSRLLDFDPERGVLANRGGDLVRVRSPLAEPEALTSDVDVAWAGFVAGAIAFTADRDGDEQLRLYAVGGRELAPDHARVVEPIVTARGLAWTEAGAIWTGERALAVDGAEWTLLAARGDVAIARRAESTRRAQLYAIDLASGTRTELGPGTHAAPGADGTIFAIDRARLVELAGGARRELAPDLAWDVTDVAGSRDGAVVAFTTNEDGASVLHLYDPHTRVHRVAPGVPAGGVIEDLRFADSTLAFTFSDARHPREVYTYDPASAQLVAWTRSDTAALDPVEPAHARTASFDGTTIAILVYRPPGRPRIGDPRAPVVIELHGGPEDQARPRWSPLAQLLVARGFAVVQPNVRGSTGYGDAFAALDDGPRRGDATRDVGAVLDWIARAPGLDASRVAVLGTSYGGYLALASLIAYPARLRAGVAISGIADLASFLAHTAAYRADARRAEYGDERTPAARAWLAALSPLPRAAQIRVPLVVAHGVRDPRVPVGDADRLVAAVRGAGGTAWFVRADDEGHGFSRLANVDVLQALVMQVLASNDLHRSR